MLNSSNAVHRATVLLPALAGVSLVVLSWLVISAFGADDQYEPMNVVSHGYPSFPTVQKAFERADFVFEGEVVQVGSPQWTTPDGTRPNLSPKEILNDPRLAIVTPFDISVDRILKGDGSLDGFTYFQGGGRVGEDQWTSASEFSFVRDGMHAIFFVKKREAGQYVMNPLKMIERYEIATTGEATGRGDVTTSVVELERIAASWTEVSK